VRVNAAPCELAGKVKLSYIKRLSTIMWGAEDKRDTTEEGEMSNIREEGVGEDFLSWDWTGLYLSEGKTGWAEGPLRKDSGRGSRT